MNLKESIDKKNFMLRVRINEQTKDKIEFLSNLDNINKSELIRNLIDAEYFRRINK